MASLYRIELASRARKELFKLSKEAQARLTEAIDALQKEPRPQGAKKLMGQEGYRIRKGDYRVLYTIEDLARLVKIYRIGHRREVYR